MVLPRVTSLLVLIIFWLTSGLFASSPRVPRILITSIPKCGTHLLARGLELLTKRPLRNLSMMNLGPEPVENDKIPATPPDAIFLDHVPYSPKAAQVLRKRKFKLLFIYRDPRDQIVSMAFWIMKKPLYYTGYARLLKEPNALNVIIKELIKEIDKVYRRFLPWKNNNLCYGVKFENLIGHQGGGSDQAQLRELHAIAQHIGLYLTPGLTQYFRRNLYGNTITFREGKIGSWKRYFTAEHKRLFKEQAGNLLVELGYERNTSW
jgi:sulfotransferase 6B1